MSSSVYAKATDGAIRLGWRGVEVVLDRAEVAPLIDQLCAAASEVDQAGWDQLRAAGIGQASIIACPDCGHDQAGHNRVTAIGQGRAGCSTPGCQCGSMPTAEPITVEPAADADVCSTCKGSGEVLDHVNEWGMPETVECSACRGTGHVDGQIPLERAS